MGEEKAVCFPMDEEKTLYFPVNVKEKDVCFPVDEKKKIRLPLDEEEEEEFVLSPRSRVDMEVFEIWGCCSFLYNRRLLPEMLWWVFSSFPPYCLSIAFDYFVAIPSHFDVGICSLGSFFYILLQSVVMLYPLLYHYWYPYRISFRSMDRKGKFMIDFIPALTATALGLNLLNDDDDKGLWHFLELNYGYLFLLLGCSGYLYVILHFMRRAYDISGKDVMLGLAMQSFCFVVNWELLVRAIALSFCFGISWYRYMTYSAPPALPPRPKMMESLPY